LEGGLDVELAVLDVDVVGGCCRLFEFAVAGGVLARVVWWLIGERMDEPETTECYFVRPDVWV